MNRQTFRWTDRHIDGQTDIQVDRQTYKWTDRHIDGQTDIQMDRQTFRWTDRHIDEQTDIQMDRQTARVFVGKAVFPSGHLSVFVIQEKIYFGKVE